MGSFLYLFWCHVTSCEFPYSRFFIGWIVGCDDSVARPGWHGERVAGGGSRKRGYHQASISGGCSPSPRSPPRGGGMAVDAHPRFSARALRAQARRTPLRSFGPKRDTYMENTHPTLLSVLSATRNDIRVDDKACILLSTLPDRPTGPTTDDAQVPRFRLADCRTVEVLSKIHWLAAAWREFTLAQLPRFIAQRLGSSPANAPPPRGSCAEVGRL